MAKSLTLPTAALDFEVSSATCTARSLKLMSKLLRLSLDATIIITRETMWHIDHTQAFIQVAAYYAISAMLLGI